MSTITALPLEDIIASKLEWTLEWWVPCAFIAFYLMSQPIFIAIRDAVGFKSNPSLAAALKYFICFHNLTLMVFSCWVMVYTWPLVFSFYGKHGWDNLNCSAEFWPEFGKWGVIFYVSKYWEFMDTWILILKGKDVFTMAWNDPMGQQMLQVYHHTGVAICMYLGCIGESNWLLYVTTLNSTIHTVMYAYYAAATLGFRTKYSAYLTIAQLTQFFIGIGFSVFSYFINGCLSKTILVLGFSVPIQWLGIMTIHAYAIWLIVLFNEMRQRKIKAAKAKKAAKVAKAN